MKHDYEKDQDKDVTKVKPTSLQQKMLAMAGQDIDQFMREMEVVHKKRETERAQDLNVRLSLLKDVDSEKTNKSTESGNTDNDHESSGKSTDHSSVLNHPAMSHPAMPLMGLPPPPPLLFRPPPPPIHLRMPPPPPPRHGLRLPPGIYFKTKNKIISMLN